MPPSVRYYDSDCCVNGFKHCNLACFQIRIRDLEDDILVRLTESPVDVTEDRALVEGLEESKRLSKEITKKLDQMKVCHLTVINKPCCIGRRTLPSHHRGGEVT